MAYNYNNQRAGSSPTQTTKDVFSHLIPEIYIKNITLRGGTGSTPLKVKLSMCANDVIEDDLISGWLVQATDSDPDTSPFEEYITINVVQVCSEAADKAFNKEISWAEAASLDSNLSHGYDHEKFSLKEKIPVNSKEGLSKYKKIDSMGNTIFELPFEQTFNVSSRLDDIRGIKYLAYYVWADLDLSGMSESLGVSQKYFEKNAAKIKKNPKKELVIQDYNTITYTNIFQTPSGEIWNGPMHRTGQFDNYDQGWATESKASDSSLPLKITSIQNKKIRDFRLMHRVGQKYVSVMDRRRAAGLTGGQNSATVLAEDAAIVDTLHNYTKRLAERGVLTEQPSALYSPMWSSTDEIHNGNFLFAFNWMPFLKRNCAYPHLWNVSIGTTNTLLNIAKIHSMKVSRIQVDTTHRSSNSLGTPHLPMKKKTKSGGYKELELASTSQISTLPAINTVNSDECFLKETKIGMNYANINHRQMRWFTMTDRSLVGQKNGDYQYTISIKSLDPTQKFMKAQILKLQTAKKQLSKYLALSEGYIKGKPNYDIYTERFSDEFVNSVSTKEGEEMWKTPANRYLNVLESVSGILQQPAYAGASYTLKTALPPALSSYLDPRKGSPEGILIAFSLIDNLEMALNKMTGGSFATSTKFGSKGWVGLANRTTSGVESKTPKSIAEQKLLESEHTFSTEIRLDGQRGMGYDYLTNQTTDFVEESMKGAGLRTISARYFRKRCEIETQRFYGVTDKSFSWSTLKSTVPDLTLSDEATGDSLDSTKYSYLSPAFVFSSPGLSLPGAAGFGGSMGSSPPASSTGGSSGQKSNMKSTFATSYALGAAKSMSPSKLLNTTNFIKNMTPVMLLGQNSNLNAAPSPKTLDDLAVDIAAQQSNPDMSLYPVDVESYKDPSLHKDTKLSSEEQTLKSKYVGVLGMNGCMLVEEEKEFDEPSFHTNRHPEGYNIETINYGKQSIILPESFLQRIKFSSILGSPAPIWKSSIPMLSKKLATINPLPLFKPLLQSKGGFKAGGNHGHISYNSIHLSNFKLLNFSDTSSPNVLTKTNPSLKPLVLKSLPNSFKSLALSKTDMVLDDLYTPKNVLDDSILPPPSIYDPENMQKIYELFHNTMRIEYLDTFIIGDEEDSESGKLEKTKGSEMLLKGPVWNLLNGAKIKELEAGENAVALLCRLTRYKNKDLGVGYDTLALPVIDEYFLMKVDPSKPVALAEDTDTTDEAFVEAAGDEDGTFQNAVDLSAFALFPNLGKFRMLEVDGEELLVKEFEGSVKCGDDE